MAKLGVTFPILSDEDKEEAIRPLGFDDEKDPRQISLPGTVIITPAGEIAYRFVGRDYADRPHSDDVLEQLRSLGLPATTQEPVAPGPSEPGPTAVPIEALGHYFRGAKFATLALRRRYRHFGREFTDDTKDYVAMVEGYLEALSVLRESRA